MILDQVRPIVHKSCQEVTIVGGGDLSIFAPQIFPENQKKTAFSNLPTHKPHIGEGLYKNDLQLLFQSQS